jgi:hypothetical protein
MRLRVEGGTARHDQPSLCLSCRYAAVVKGLSLRHEIVKYRRLSEPHNRVAFPVTFCNGYIERGHPSIGEMQEITWVLRSDPKRNRVGFVRASDLKPKERRVLPDEWY